MALPVSLGVIRGLAVSGCLPVVAIECAASFCMELAGHQ
jgi:hypothetical protein